MCSDVLNVFLTVCLKFIKLCFGGTYLNSQYFFQHTHPASMADSGMESDRETDFLEDNPLPHFMAIQYFMLVGSLLDVC